MGITIGGVNYDAHLSRQTLRHINALTSEPDALEFNLKPGAPKPAIGSEVIYTLPNGSRLFGGVLTFAPEVRMGNGVGYQCSCTDWRPRANRKTLNDRFTNKTAGEIVVAAFAKYAPEFDTSLVSLEGQVIDSIRFKRGTYLTDLLDALKNITGYVWDINPDKQVIWEAPGTTTAPISLTDTSRNFRELVVEVNRDGLRNKVIVRGGFYPSSVSVTDTFNGDNLTTNFRLSRTPYGNDQYVVFSEDFGSLDSSKWLKTSPSNPTPPAGHIATDGYIFTTTQQGASLAESGSLQVVGGNSTWGAVRLTSYEVVGRGDNARRFEFDVYPGNTTGQGRVGLWNPNNLSALAGEAYGFFFDAGTIKPSEAGVIKTALVSVPYVATTGAQYRFRIVPKAAGGATYWVNSDFANGFRASQWVKLYDSSAGTLPNLALVPIFNHSFVGRVDRIRVNNPLFGIGLTVAGIAKTVGLLGQDEDAGVDALIGASTADVPVLAFFGDTKPASGTGNVSITYYPRMPVIVQAQDSASIEAIAALEGHDGIYEGYIEDDNLDSPDLARARAAQELEQTANPVTTITFFTKSPGLRSGQVIPATLTQELSGRDLDGSFLIQAVETVSLGSGEYEYAVTAGSRLKGIDDYLLDLLRKGRMPDAADDDFSVIDELMFAGDSLAFSDSGTVSGPALTNADALTFTDLGAVASGPLPPYKYGSAQYGKATYA